SFFIAEIVFAQTDLDKIRSYRQVNESSIYNEFISFLQIPNVATDTANIRKNANYLVQLMRAKGINNIQLLEANGNDVPPVVYGECIVANATKTVIFYAHYDGQPVNPALWAKG